MRREEVTTAMTGALHIRLLVCIGIVVGVVLPVSAQSTEVPFVTIAAGTVSGIRHPVHVIIRDQPAWQSLWRRHSGLPVAPSVDFSHNMVIAVFAGEFTEPAALTIVRIVRERTQLVVLYRSGATRPPLDGASTVPVTPFHIVGTARATLGVTFSQIKTPPVVVPPP